MLPWSLTSDHQKCREGIYIYNLCQLLFSCWDEYHDRGNLRGRKGLFSLSCARIRFHCVEEAWLQLTDVLVWSGSWARILNHKHKTESKQRMMWDFKLSKPASSKATPPKVAPNSVTDWGQSVQIPKNGKTFLIPTTTSAYPKLQAPHSHTYPINPLTVFILLSGFVYTDT